MAEGHIFQPISDWLTGSLGPWVTSQLSSVFEQIIALTISATVGGIISWRITRRSDEKARARDVEREVAFQVDQELRDKQRNLFEYRNWRATNPDSADKKWKVRIDTRSPYRSEWVLEVTPKFNEDVRRVDFEIRSMLPEPPSTRLTSSFISRNPVYASSGMNWVQSDCGDGHWAVRSDETTIFLFDIGSVIDNADYVTIFCATKEGSGIVENYPISPFDSMKEYRPWNTVDLENNE